MYMQIFHHLNPFLLLEYLCMCICMNYNESVCSSKSIKYAYTFINTLYEQIILLVLCPHITKGNRINCHDRFCVSFISAFLGALFPVRGRFQTGVLNKNEKKLVPRCNN